MIRIFFLTLGCLYLSTLTVVSSELAQFTPKRGFLFMDPFEYASTFSPVASLFQNPAGVACTDLFQFSLVSTQGYFSYKYTAMGMVIPIHEPVVRPKSLQDRLVQLEQTVKGKGALAFERSDFTMGVAVSQFGANDFIESYFEGDSRAGVRGSRLSDTMDQAVFVLTYSPLEDLDIGVSAKFFQRTLVTERLEAYNLDVGVLWHVVPNIQWGVYTSNFFQSNFRWNENSDAGVLERDIVMAINSVIDDYQFAFSTNFRDYRFQGSKVLYSAVTFLMDMVLSHGYDLKRYGYGVRLSLGEVALEYFRSDFVLDDIGVFQDTLGFVFQF